MGIEWVTCDRIVTEADMDIFHIHRKRIQKFLSLVEQYGVRIVEERPDRWTGGMYTIFNIEYDDQDQQEQFTSDVSHLDEW